MPDSRTSTVGAALFAVLRRITRSSTIASTVTGYAAHPAKLVLPIGAASALMTFPGMRQIGASLLASAGVAGIAAGIAARPVLGNLIADLQIALTQPIRLDDVVIMENEWGCIEEITAAYVMVKIWDERRLVVPLQWVIEHPFQNWTSKSPARETARSPLFVLNRIVSSW